ncbi:uncharacterized protein LOC131606138 isoform X1 [Vicia villosa]|uniref:uncharacterized protein LOC131606138 isoform X1 n=1 Tax=Vicia villosa TaxID=3911 RepID=UPI00273B71CD|nr:uncharacterized protein LOC131606138 isoform X1 [Vicia villosa]
MKLLNLPPPPFFFSSFSTLPRFPTSSFSLSIPSHLPFNPLPSSSSTSLRRLRCRAALPDPPPPHSSDQPPGNDSIQLQNVGASFSKFQDRVQIFFAVLFWMSLFFWASAWDGRNRPNNGSKFRK